MQVMPRESWTDERLDDFRVDVNRRFDEVDRRFDEVDRRFDEARDDVNRRFDEQRAESVAIRREMKEGFERVDKRFERVNEQFERMYRLMITIGVAIVLAVLSNHL